MTISFHVVSAVCWRFGSPQVHRGDSKLLESIAYWIGGQPDNDGIAYSSQNNITAITMMNSGGRTTSLSSLDDSEWQTATIESSEEWNSQQQILATSVATRCSVGEYSCLSIDDLSGDSESESSFSGSVVSFVDDEDGSESDSSESEGYYYEPQHKRQQQRNKNRSSITGIASLLGQQAIAYLSTSSRGFFTNTTKSVSFDHRQNEIHEIPSTGDFSKQQCSAIWYQRDELKRVRRENQRLVKLLDQGILFVDDDDMCYGLETEEDSQLRQRISESSVRNVCVEQEQCINDEEYEDENDDKIAKDEDADTAKSSSSSREERLSTVYFESSFACQLEAHQRALQLERDIQDYVCPAPKCRWGADEGEMSSSSIFSIVSRRISDGTQQGLPMQPTRRDSFRSINLNDIDFNHADDSSSDGDEGDESTSSSGDLSVATYMSDNSTIVSQQDSIQTPTSPTSMSSSASLSSSSSAGSSSSDSSSKGPPKMPKRRLAKTVEIWSPTSIRM